MQQDSSVPEGNVEAYANRENTAANTSKALEIQQLRGKLWLECCLNQLQHRINNCLTYTFTTEQTANQSEAEIFQAVVNELSLGLGTCPVALVFAETSGSDRSSKSEPGLKVCYVAPTRQARTAYTKPSTVFLATGKTFQFKLGEVITLKDLQHLETQKPQIAWSLDDDRGVQGWLIAANSPLPFNSQSLGAFTAEYRSQLIERSLAAAMFAIVQSRRLQTAFLEYQQSEARNRELRRISQLKSEFLANTSHEIRTPLSSILGFTHLLQAQGYRPDNLRHQEYLNILLTSGQHLLALINDILDLSKIEANQLEVQKEPVDVPGMCRSVLALVKEKAGDKGLQLRLELDPDATTIVADSLRLKQMLFNLLSNALKFTSKGSVGLQVKPKGGFIHLTVWDTGTGISKEEQSQLFQPYSQIANVVAGRQEGTGLGLALTQKLAELHGGWVEVKSELNRGSQFTVVLPLTPPSVKEVEQVEQGENRRSNSIASSHHHAPTPCKATAPIMLVEDNFHNAKLITTYLKKLGYQVTWVKNAAQMWQALEELLPALILMDVHLPDVDGLTLVQQLQAHEQYRTIPVIAQTAMAMKGDRESCLAAGAIDYISKPIDLKILATLVSEYSARDR